ncbi:GPP34 family phosphoprotein [Streptomyces sp. LX-29]|uniref:GOLPH3/VPS74 family protein n=1 Tax=Streptomyces sp. LX-29 TaxID=2900152 RepID=UPI00240E8F38|nr:GPP34 family phosphoprotein [Streptomyces sp. LX-29]WFB06717.1 GPP34 family phosphoprotein [Streptomyces sp. LX-29]
MPDGSFSLAAKLYLLAWDPDTGEPGYQGHLPYLVRAGALTELTQRGMLADADGVPRPLPDAVTGDPPLDALLERIAESRPRSWPSWVTHRARSTLVGVRDELAAAGYLRLTTRRALGLFPVKQVALERADAVRALRVDARRVLREEEGVAEVAPEDAALIALAAAGELRTVVTADDARTRKARIVALEQRSQRAAPGAARPVAEVRRGVAVALTGAVTTAAAATD